MKIPTSPTPTEFNKLTPTLYSAALKCKAKAIWLKSPASKEIPENPFGVLGQCFHAVLEASKRPVKGDLSTVKQQLRNTYDSKAKEIMTNAHDFTKHKFMSFDELPFYYLSRERAVRLALTNIVISEHGNSESKGLARHRVEKPLDSKDGLLSGRPDLVDREKKQIVDYKTGDPSKPDADQLTDDERLQLLFYACLAADNAIDVTQGVIVRADGREVILDFTTSDVAELGKAARADLASLNQTIKTGKKFEDFAEPSISACANCSCMPACEKFWDNATPDWLEECGVNFEGTIDAVEETTSQLYGDIVNLTMSKTNGTVNASTVYMSNIPRNWLTNSGAPIPIGAKVRIVKARLEQDQEHVELKFDKAFTSCWLD